MKKLKIALATLLVSSPALVMAGSAGDIAESLGSQASTATTANRYCVPYHGWYGL